MTDPYANSPRPLMDQIVPKEFRESTPAQQAAIINKGKKDKDTSNSWWKAFLRLFTKDKATLP